jgi:hypothetical protein
MKSIIFPVVLATALLLGENIMMAAEITVIPTPQEVIRTDEPCKITLGTQVRVEVPEQVNDLGTGIQMLTEVLEKEFGAMLNPQPGKSAKLTIYLSLDRKISRRPSASGAHSRRKCSRRLFFGNRNEYDHHYGSNLTWLIQWVNDPSSNAPWGS